ncbi:hypothetical protein ABB37_08225 [Leptomonas pyrrhocoris]|uniref:SET domain-containing protein n=1 Tax=Leptomonas pyrrhocoris TaxID=157538 RepID=A0A0N0VDP5_LEPPY|nr:hypothetical protein ABB37_08225 [Leptomonas pyrrhocoris]KPA75658.1 hypothetical protein ABB37_08225 [Leptomonas pyrrhocoris]|eukprot:XP_015654097.1 hypothetical protein ABB37_08225 [Leptomonas pyrrhocoris]
MPTMEELRLKGNKCFADDPAEASQYYLQAVELYEAQHTKDASCTLDEFAKSAGNALTCLFKVGETEQCAALATRVLRSNPILAKANAFYGRCALVDPSLDVASEGNGTASAAALMFLCRAMYELPALEESTRDNVEEALTRLMQEQLTVFATFNTTRDHAMRVVAGKHGNGVEAIRIIPAYTEVASLLTPFSVGAYEESGGKGCCVECSRPIQDENEAGNDAHEDDDDDDDGDGGEKSSANGGVTEERESKQKNSSGIRGCPACDMVAYCSEKCEETHRKQHEQFECARMQRLKEMMRGIEARKVDAPEMFYELAYHCITTVAGLRAQRTGHDRVLTLSAHVDEVVQSLHPIGPLMCDLFKNEEQPPLLYQVIGVLRCNALEVTDESGLGVGQGLHIGEGVASYYNHSCAPNCAIDPVLHRIITTRTVQPGEEMTIAYIPQLYWPTRLRQERLSEGYFFVCRCPRCVKGDKDAFELALSMALPTARSDATKHYHSIVQVRCSAVRARSVEDVSAKDAEELNSLLSELMRHLFPFHYLCHEVRNCLSFVYAVLGDSQRCLSSCLDELLMWECILPGALPVKQLKIANALQCLQGLGPGATCAAALYPHLSRLALLYEVAEPN